jgi:hypothetical protein
VVITASIVAIKCRFKDEKNKKKVTVIWLVEKLTFYESDINNEGRFYFFLNGIKYKNICHEGENSSD